MRITGGQWRGRRLEAVPGRDVRPTTDRVREALFSMLAPDLPGAEVADLCCGSGALALEALSRGARRAVLVDLAPAALRVARANLERCGCDRSRYELRRTDAVRWLARRLAREGSPLVVVADPPYATPVAGRLVATLATAAHGAQVRVAVIEHAADAPLPVPAGFAWAAEERRYGSSALTILRRPATLEPDPHPETMP